jgi:hypothetical protein
MKKHSFLNSPQFTLADLLKPKNTDSSSSAERNVPNLQPKMLADDFSSACQETFDSGKCFDIGAEGSALPFTNKESFSKNVDLLRNRKQPGELMVPEDELKKNNVENRVMNNLYYQTGDSIS